jgi:hypothetical protein
VVKEIQLAEVLQFTQAENGLAGWQQPIEPYRFPIRLLAQSAEQSIGVSSAGRRGMSLGTGRKAWGRALEGIHPDLIERVRGIKP